MPEIEKVSVVYPMPRKILAWVLIAALFFWVLYIFRASLFTYVLGAAIAYFLDPVADKIEKWSGSRGFAVTTIFILFFAALGAALFFIVPELVAQLLGLVNNIPAMVNFISERSGQIIPLFEDLTLEYPVLLDISESAITQLRNMVAGLGSFIGSSIASSTASLLWFISVIVILPFVLFYFLMDWDNFVGRIVDLLPRDRVEEIRTVAKRVDLAISGFIRGQGTVCLIMAIYYSLVLQLFGLNYGLAIGTLAGLLTFIPFVGGFIGGFLVIGMTAFQFWGDWTSSALILLFYYGGQTVEGNFLTPRLVGNSVGLHPLMILFSLSAFGGLWGIAGMVIAVPLTASLVIILKHFVDKYRASPLYLGEDSVNEPYDETASP